MKQRSGRQKPFILLVAEHSDLKLYADFLSMDGCRLNKAQPNKPSRLVIYGF